MQSLPPRLRVNIEYCKSCDTHTWCTHHDQQKYFNTFLKLKHYLEKQFQSELIVNGNLIPQELVPIKPAQNKYYNQKTNKYVQFPLIGAFQVTIQNQVIFSKKKTNAWPNLQDIGDRIYQKIYGTQRAHNSIDSKKSPSKQRKSPNSKKQQRLHTLEGDIKTQKDNWSDKNKSFLDNNDKRSTFYKPKPNYKNFTLTDHFKNYHNANYKNPIINNGFRYSDQFFTANQTENEQQNMLSELDSNRQQDSSETQFLEFKKSFDIWTHKQSKSKLSELLKRKGQIRQDSNGGRKQMIIKLDSIEQQSILVDQNGLTNTNQGQTLQTPTNYFNNTHTTFRSRQKQQTHKEIMRKFDDDLDQLQQKFKNFQQRVETIRQENLKFDDIRQKKYPSRQSMPKIMNEKAFRQMKQANKKQRKLKSSQHKDLKEDLQQEQEDMVNNPIIFAKRKLKNIEDYINGTQEQKNQKLKKIYGEWKLFRKPYKGKNYISPYRMDLLKRIGTGEVNQRNSKRKKDQIKQYKGQQSSDDSSLDDQQLRQGQIKHKKIPIKANKIPKMPPMPTLKSPKQKQMMSQQQFYPSSRTQIKQIATKRLKKKESQINTKSSELLRNTQNYFHHRAGAGIKINTVDQINQKSYQNQANQKELFPKSFIRSKQKINKNGRILRSIDKTDVQSQLSRDKFSSKIRKLSKSEKNLHKMSSQSEQFKFQQRKLKGAESEQLFISGHSNDSQKLFKNFRSKKNAHASKSKEKQSNLNGSKQLKKADDVSQEEGNDERIFNQQSNKHSQSLQNNYFEENPSSKLKSASKKIENKQRIKKGYQKDIGENKQWRESRIQSKQKRSSYHKQDNISESKNAKKQKSIQNSSQFKEKSIRKSTTEQNLSERNQNKISFGQNKNLSKKSKHQRERQIYKQKSQNKYHRNQSNSQIQSDGKRQTKKQKKQKERQLNKHQTIIELKDLDQSQSQDQFIELRGKKFIDQENQEEQNHTQNGFDQNQDVSESENQQSQESQNQQLSKNRSKIKQDQVKTIAKIQNIKNSRKRQDKGGNILQQNEDSEEIEDNQEQNRSEGSKTKRRIRAKKEKANSKNDYRSKISVEKQKSKIYNTKQKPIYHITNQENQQSSQHQEENQIQLQNQSENLSQSDNSRVLNSFSQQQSNQQGQLSQLKQSVKNKEHPNFKNYSQSKNNISSNQKLIQVKKPSNKLNTIKSKNLELIGNQNQEQQQRQSQNSNIDDERNSQNQSSSNLQNTIQQKNNSTQAHNNLKKEVSKSKRFKNQGNQTENQNLSESEQKKSEKSQSKLQNQKGLKQDSDSSQQIQQSRENQDNPISKDVKKTKIHSPQEKVSQKLKNKIQKKKERQVSNQNHQNMSHEDQENSNREEQKCQNQLLESNQIKIGNEQQSDKIETKMGLQKTRAEKQGQIREKNVKNQQIFDQQDQNPKQESKNKVLNQCQEPLGKLQDEKPKQNLKIRKNIKQSVSKDEKIIKQLNQQEQQPLISKNNSSEQNENKQEISQKTKQIAPKKPHQFSSNVQNQNKPQQNQNSSLINEKSPPKQKQNNAHTKKPNPFQSNSIKQQASKSHLLVQDHTERLNTARSVKSKNKIIGIYNSKQNDSQEQKSVSNEDQPQNKNNLNRIIDSKNNNSQQNEESFEVKNKQNLNSDEGQQKQNQNSFEDNVGYQEKKINKRQKNQTNQVQSMQQNSERKYRDIGIQFQHLQSVETQKLQNFTNSLQKSNNPQKQQSFQTKSLIDKKGELNQLNGAFQNKNKNDDRKEQYLEENRNQNLLEPVFIQNSSNLQSETIKNKSFIKQNQQNSAQKQLQKANKQQISTQSPQQPQLELQKSQLKTSGKQKEIQKTFQTVQKNILENNLECSFEEEQIQIFDKTQESIRNSQTSNKIIRAPITKQFYGQSFNQQIKIYPSISSQQSDHKNFSSLLNFNQTIPQNSLIDKLPNEIVSNNICLFNPKSIQVHKIISNHPLPNLLKCLKILADINQFLIIRLFENPSTKITQNNVFSKKFGIWLCINYEWKCTIIDLNQILLSEQNGKQSNSPFYLSHSNNQIWPIVLETALAKALKSYKVLASLPCHKIFNILTGSNSLFFNVKQDPTKNNRILRYISDCENKNFILHAEKVCKNLQELERSQKQTKIFYVMSQKIVNQNQILLQIRQSLRPDSQWMKLTKFVQEFKSIQILQLRLNHNFSSIKLPKPMNTSNLTIIQLQFLQESFGSITLSTAGGQLCPSLRTYLYKQEKSNVLKLVGEAKQKNKATLFFDCFFGQTKYYLFVESSVESRVTYLGENQPLIKIVEEINSDGLKNDYTEYLPIKSMNSYSAKTGSREFAQSSLGFRMPNRLNKSRFGETGMSFKSQQDEKISRLRENFVEYLLRGKD